MKSALKGIRNRALLSGGKGKPGLQWFCLRVAYLEEGIEVFLVPFLEKGQKSIAVGAQNSVAWESDIFDKIGTFSESSNVAGDVCVAAKGESSAMTANRLSE